MDAAAIERLRAKDEAAFACLLEMFEAPLGRYLHSLTGDRDLAKDLLQETFLRAFLHVGELRNDLAVKPWLYRIATNLAMTALKRRRRLRWLPLIAARPMAVTQSFEDGVAERDRVQRALGKLPADYSACLLLTRVEGLKSHEAAVVLGVSPEAVRKRVSRAQEMLRQELGEGDGDAL